MLRTALVLAVLAGTYSVHGFDPDFTIRNRIIADGYYTESHQVTTEDGYILEMNRIPYGRFQDRSTSNAKRPVVILMHGIMTSAICFLVLGPQSAIAYNLADAGYDVWMGNARGVANSRNHAWLNPDDAREKMEFFDFSFEEIGLFDLPAMIDYALKTTGQKNLHYVGHSQGGTVFLTMASTRPEYNTKIKSAHLLAGVGYQEHTPGTLVHLLAERTTPLYAFARLTGFVELDAKKIRDTIVPFDDELCSGDNPEQMECELRSVISVARRIKNLFQIPDRIAMKQLAHYGQNIRDKTFRRWDYGSVTNLLKYGRLTPPNYDLSNISTDVTWHYSLQDLILSEQDVMAMVATIPNAKAKRVEANIFLHSDYLSLPSVKRLVTDYIIEDVNKYYEQCRYEY